MSKLQRAFDDIHAREELKNKVLDKCGMRTKKRFVPRLTAAAALVIFFCTAGALHMASIEAAYISIDVNPSVGLSLNCFRRVISADAYNDAAADILKGLKLKGKKYSDAVDEILNTEQMSGYDLSTAEIYIEGRSDNLSREISDTMSHSCPHAGTSCHELGNRARAAEYNISPGKYYIIEQIIPYGGTVDEYKDMSVKELKEIYSAYSGEEPLETGQNHHGSGHHGAHKGKNGI